MKNIFSTSILCALFGVAALTSCSGEEVVIPDNPETPVAVNKTTSKIIYEANPRMYGTQDGLVAIKNQLSQIKDYGTDIIWVMPIQTPGELNAIGSPYCVRDFSTVNPKLGTMQDFLSLVNDAHAQGMQVILDWVANHTAWDCAWVSQHPDWYVRNAQGEIQSPSGWTDVAELNYDNADMRAQMIAEMKYWVANTGIDGFRLDNTDGVPDDFWAECISALRAVKSDLFILAETSRTEAYDWGADMIYGWHFASDLTGLFNGKANQSDLVSCVKDDAEQTPDDNATRIMHYSINHDTAAENTIQELYGSQEGAEAAYAIALFMGGTPMFYTSQLIDYSGKASFFTYQNSTFNSDKIAAVKRINSIFKTTAEVRQGELSQLIAGKCVLLQYELGDSHLVLAANPTSKAFEVKMPIEVAGLQVKDLVSGQDVTMPVAETLEPYAYKLYLK